MCTEKQRKCMYALSKELGVSMDYKAVMDMSGQEVSDKIDEMKAKLETKPIKDQVAKNIRSKEFNAQRFGMVCKIILAECEPQWAVENTNKFKDRVIVLYKLITQVEAALSASTTLTPEQEELMLERGREKDRKKPIPKFGITWPYPHIV